MLTMRGFWSGQQPTRCPAPYLQLRACLVDCGDALGPAGLCLRLWRDGGVGEASDVGHTAAIARGYAAGGVEWACTTHTHAVLWAAGQGDVVGMQVKPLTHTLSRASTT